MRMKIILMLIFIASTVSAYSQQPVDDLQGESWLFAFAMKSGIPEDVPYFYALYEYSFRADGSCERREVNPVGLKVSKKIVVDEYQVIQSGIGNTLEIGDDEYLYFIIDDHRCILLQKSDDNISYKRVYFLLRGENKEILKNNFMGDY